MSPSDFIEIQPVGGPLAARVRPPGSKSLTNRALVCAALADGESTLTGALVSDDTHVMIEGLSRLGIPIDVLDNGTTLRVAGAGGQVPAIEAELFIGNSGTTVRFLTALATLGHGAFRLDGVARMRERPLQDLADALNSLGATVRCESPGGCPPVSVHANGLPGGEASVRGDISSQFLSALLMACPCAASPVTLRVDGELVSQPYVRMTLEVMRAFGVEVTAPADLSRFELAPAGCYQPLDYAIEPDASAASYFWAAAAICGGEVTVEGLTRNALQGDVAFVDCLEKMGCRVEHLTDGIKVVGPAPGEKLRGAKLDMNAISDTVQTLAAVALFADGPTEVSGVAHNRHKETDRIADLATELRRLGASVEEKPDGLVITPGELRPALVETYDDHRMAMSLALVGLRQPGVRIANPGCTAKTYPNYFEDLSATVSKND
ncbi:3-phosphoshikimate 1-carboxyvinyltransferase [Botrimarina colliarenosi]|uniref:3-phosphoshikimate 1-carboxyvinyltransferase n=1 Tax=Botrimarina colliarenosi TaxID=2528001 RepID=A0A5C6AFD8_9BACT|nr:3-phosphoshikimate 1-carboxyvinyltransferase [Botrimarina colliarenosi]TWT98038.1 3-phosphoshikimate 1-carboxyvinyltransferase [Botrimarina colliarenosi]